MKTNFIFLLVFLSLTFLSCKKKYSCVCTYSETSSVDKNLFFSRIDNKKNAEDWCKSYDTTYTNNGVTISYRCKIDD